MSTFDSPAFAPAGDRFGRQTAAAVDAPLVDLSAAQTRSILKTISDSAPAASVPRLELPHMPAHELKELALSQYGPSNVTDWDTKHAALVAKAAKTEAKLQFFGDSITEYMGRNLDAFNRNFSRLKPDNFGIAGDTTTGLLRRVNDGELGGHPKALVLMIGTNDLPGPASADQIAKNIAKIVESIRLNEPHTKILIMGLLPRCSPTDPFRVTANEKLQKVNAEIKQLSNGNTIRFIDIGSKFEDAHGYARKDLLPDYLHPNNAGYQVWSDAIKPVIEAMTQDRTRHPVSILKKRPTGQ